MSDVDTRKETLLQILDKVEVLREAIVERISMAEAQTTPEVLHAGDQVNRIVEIIRGHEKDTDAFVKNSFNEFILLMNEHSASAEKSVEEQAEAISIAKNMMKNISRAGSNIESLSMSARLLTINAKILAASMTSQGEEVNALASEMKNLSDEIASNNEKIQELTETLLATLPQISRTSVRIDQTAKETMQKMNRLEGETTEVYQRIAQESRDTLKTIGDAAYEALSHLQFHDPLVQRLKSIDTFVYRLLTELAEDANVSRHIRPPMLGFEYLGTLTQKTIDEADEHVAEAGEPLIF